MPAYRSAHAPLLLLLRRAAAPLILAAALLASLPVHEAAAQAPPPATFDENGVLRTATASAAAGASGTCITVDFTLSILQVEYSMSYFCIRTGDAGGVFYSDDSLDFTNFDDSFMDTQFAFEVAFYSSGGTRLFGRGNTTQLGRVSKIESQNVNIEGMNMTLDGVSMIGGGAHFGSHIVSGQVYGQISIYSSADIYISNRDTDIPGAPGSVISTRNADYTEATVNWNYVGPVVEYEVEREQAITVTATETLSTQYGNTVRFLVPGTVWGVDHYTDATVDPRYTYRYRVRARRGADKWGDYSIWTVSGGQPGLDLNAPGGFEVARARDNSQVVLNWTAPAGDFDGFAVQRQELTVADGSTIFANTRTLASSLSADTLTYTDDSIAPGRSYEYRVAATQGGTMGDYTQWARATPFILTFGTAPQNLHLVEDGTARLLDDRREFWMRWDEVEGADDYEVEVRVYDSAGGRALERYVYSDPAYFRTAYGRVELRARGQMSDDDLCGDGDGMLEPGEDCHTEWTGWYGVGFSPKAAPAPGPAPLSDPSIEEFRDDVDELVNVLDQSGVDVDPSVAVQFAVLVGTVLVSITSIVVGWKRGMKPLGVGMAFSVTVISLYLANQLLGIPAAWPIGAQALIVIPGLVAFARQVGAFR